MVNFLPVPKRTIYPISTVLIFSSAAVDQPSVANPWKLQIASTGSEFRHFWSNFAKLDVTSYSKEKPL